MIAQWGQDIWDTKIGVTVGWDSPDRSVCTGLPDIAAWTGQRVQGGQDMTATARKRQAGQVSWAQEYLSRTAGTGKPGRQSGKNSQKRKQNTRRSEHDSKDRTVAG
jgi:hypothetical protein